ncbi:MAG: glucose 1-dehydrogenase [Dehalococcoidia bacterium]|jgi:NAD(P)-dependent dehydrogenase (short-subunit alcohol dehydrogenase family)
MILDVFSLKSRVAIVTGAGRGIGKAIAMGMAEAGATVVVAARTREQVEATAAAINESGGKSLAITADVRNKEKVDYLINETLGKYGRIDILVNNAGGMFAVQTMEMSEKQWDVIISENLKSVFLCSQAAGKIMISQRSGSIVNIASIVGIVAQPLNAAYAAAKAGVINLTKTMATDLAPYGIRVNGIAPGLIITPGTEWLYDKPGSVVDQIPLARGGRPEDIIGGVIYLASDASLYVTGETLVIDGGLITRPPITQPKLAQ